MKFKKNVEDHIHNPNTRNAIPPMAIAITIPAAEIASAFLQPDSDASTRITEMQGMQSIETSARTISWTGDMIAAKFVVPKITARVRIVSFFSRSRR